MKKGGLDFLADRTAFVRRFILAEVLGPPRGVAVPRAPRAPRPRPAAPATPTAPVTPSTTSPDRDR
jgi:hypothetical protein